MSLSSFFHAVKLFYTQPNDQTVVFQTIQFNRNTGFFCLYMVKYKNSSISNNSV